MNKLFKESVLWALILLPYVYLYTMYNELPEKVPTHFDINGVANAWSSKISLLFIPCGLGILLYFLFLVLPYIDPKKKIQQMGNKYDTLRFAIAVFIALLSCYILYASKTGEMKNSSMLFAIVGGLFAVLGNYFQTVRPNYFIGIRTPWTLENEEVWKKTHRLAGKIWMIGGVLIVALSFCLNSNHLFAIIFRSLLAIMVLVPVGFSYVEFKKEK